MSSALDQLYNPTILQHCRSPQNRRPLADATGQCRTLNAACGDAVSVSVREEAAVLTEAAFEGEACAICVASASILTAAVSGLATRDAAALAESMLCRLGVLESAPAEEPAMSDEVALLAAIGPDHPRVKCVSLPWESFQGALRASAMSS